MDRASTLFADSDPDEDAEDGFSEISNQSFLTSMKEEYTTRTPNHISMFQIGFG